MMSGRPDLDDLRHRLPFYARDIALDTLGKPDSKTSREWRWGRWRSPVRRPGYGAITRAAKAVISLL